MSREQLYPEERKGGIQVTHSSFTKEQPSSPDKQNEDAFLVFENEQIFVAAVIDGASSLHQVTSSDVETEFDGRFASLTIRKSILDNAETAESAYQLVMGANEDLAGALRERGVDVGQATSLELPAAYISLIRIDKTKKEADLCQVGDTAILLEDDSGIKIAASRDTEIFDDQAMTASVKIVRVRNVSMKEAIQDPVVAGLMEKSRLHGNYPGGNGSGVLNGKPELSEYIDPGNNLVMSLQGVRRFVLLTDGLFLPTEQFNEEPDWEMIARIVKVRGMKGLYDEVADLKESDPELTRYPRFKQFDDATGIEIIFK